MKTIEVIVSPAGQTTIETRGFVGPSCRDATKFLEQALGRRSTEDLTTEFHHSEATELTQRQRT